MSAQLAQHNAAAPRRPPWQLWAIAAVSIAPLLLSFAAYEFWQPAATVNYGTLLATDALPDTPLHLIDGTDFRLSQLRGRWVLLMVDGGACDGYCARKLYMLRQLRLAQGQDMRRIERVWLVSDQQAPDAATLSGYQGTWLVRAGASALLGALPVIKDIGRLLKASRIE